MNWKFFRTRLNLISILIGLISAGMAFFLGIRDVTFSSKVEKTPPIYQWSETGGDDIEESLLSKPLDSLSHFHDSLTVHFQEASAEEKEKLIKRYQIDKRAMLRQSKLFDSLVSKESSSNHKLAYLRQLSSQNESSGLLNSTIDERLDKKFKDVYQALLVERYIEEQIQNKIEQIVKKEESRNFWVKLAFSVVLGTAALYVILVGKYSEEANKWAFGLLTLIAGVWIGSF